MVCTSNLRLVYELVEGGVRSIDVPTSPPLLRSDGVLRTLPILMYRVCTASHMRLLHYSGCSVAASITLGYYVYVSNLQTRNLLCSEVWFIPVVAFPQELSLSDANASAVFGC